MECCLFAGIRLKTKELLMSKAGDKIHIPLSTDKALAGLMKVRPTAEMPKTGAVKKTAAKKSKRKK